MKTAHLEQSHSPRLVKARGITLIELLIVVTIMVVLMGVTIPLLKPALADRKLREAARQVTAYLQTAQAHAIERGRPVAVMFLRASSDSSNPDINTCYEMAMAESPPPYIGDSANAPIVDVQFKKWPPQSPPNDYFIGTDFDIWDAVATFNGSACGSVGVQYDPSSPNAPTPLVLPGDLIQFNSSGPYYRIKHVYSNTANNPSLAWTQGPVAQYEVVFSPSKSNPDAPRPEWLIDSNIPKFDPMSGTRLFNAKSTIRFKVIRQPLRTAVTAMELPTGTMVSLGLSGERADDYAYNPMADPVFGVNANSLALNYPTSPIMISFSPQGSVESIYRDFEGYRPLAPANLMIGRADLKNDQTNLDEQNLNDLANFWVTVHHRTGSIKVSENASLTASPSPVNPNNVRAARRLARTAETAGGS